MGEHDITSIEDWKKSAKEPFTVQDIDIDDFFAYPKYDRHSKLNDIGLIRLESHANLMKPNIATICLPAEEDNQFEELEAISEGISQNLIIAGLLESKILKTF